MNAISYSLFGYNEKHENCLDFRSYLRGLEVNIRVAELLYPGWKIYVTTDEATHASPYKGWFDYHESNEKIELQVVPKQPLCLMMLHRVSPMFEEYDRFICRDTDSLLSYRERQAVGYWEQGPKTAHGITDSVSHNIALMGGMCGFVSDALVRRMGVHSFKQLIDLAQNIDWNRKGADQEFLNRYVLPKVSDSITEHFVLGHPQSWRGDCHNTIQDIDLGLPEAYKETNHLAFHIGASGFQTDATITLLEQYGKNNAYYKEIEQQYKETFYWEL